MDFLDLIKKRLKSDIPRSIIFGIDLLIVCFTYLVTYFFLSNFYGKFETGLVYQKIIIILCSYIISFLIIRPYRSLIRQTCVRDIERVFLSCLLASIISCIPSLLVRNGIILSNVDTKLYLRQSYSFLLMHMLLTAFILTCSRVFYSQFYRTYIIDAGKQNRVLIYGAGDSGLITLNVLKAETKVRTQIIGFIDDNLRKVGQRVAGYKIFSIEDINKHFVLKNRIDDVIISIQNVSNERLNEIVEQFISLPVTLKIIPPAKDWMDGKYSNKQIKDLRIEDLLGRKSINLKKDNIANDLNNKVILVTGAAGSIGSEISSQIALFNFKKLILLDHAESALYDVQQTLVCDKKENVTFIVGNIREELKMRNVFEKYKPDYVYHAAAYKHVPLMEDYPQEAIHTNIYGTKIIADLALEFNVEKFVMVSTDKAVNPTNVMGATKRAAEIYVSSLKDKGKTSFIVTRFGNVLGSNGSVIPIFKRQLEKGGPLTVTHAEVTRFFMTIPEACQLVLEASVMGKAGDIFVFDMGKSVKIIDLAKRMIKLSGLEYPTDIDIKITGLRPGEKIFEELLANNENTVKTHHEKIMIAKIREQDLVVAQENIIRLCSCLLNKEEPLDPMYMVGQLKVIVPEFKSQNSVFTVLDN